jgi:hypothetical protein
MRALKYKKVIAVAAAILITALSVVLSITLYERLLIDFDSVSAGILSGMFAYGFMIFGLALSIVLYRD